MNQARYTEDMDNLNALPDKELLRRFVHHQDEQAFESLVRRHSSLVMGVCRRVLQHAQDTEDAFQATFLVLARKAPSIQNYQSLAGWLYKVAYRIALRARANRNRRKTNESQFLAALNRTTPSTRENEMDHLVDEEVQRLPEKYRTPLLLCYLQGQTNEEAAQLLRCPTGTVKIRLLRGREMLRKRLLRQGVGLSLTAWLAGQTSAVAATVPQTLLQDTAAAASQLRSGAALGQLGVSSTAVKMAQSWLKNVALAKVKITCAVLLTVLLLVITDHLAQKALGESVSIAPAVPPVELVPLPEYPSPQPEEKKPEIFVDHVSADYWA